VASEAGAHTTDFSAAPYSIFEKEIVCTNGAIHDELIKILEQ
jgi:myo-inositol-1(or 4)-monophosphatase